MASLQKTSSQRTKDRIQEIRNRVFQETPSAPKISNEDANIDISNGVLEANKALIDPNQQLEAAQEVPNELATAKVIQTSSSVSIATNEAPKQHNSDKKSVHQEIIDFERLKAQITDEINTEFSLLKKRTDEKLTDFVSKIPDIQKGSKIRDELLHDIEIMFSQKVIEQNQSIDGLIKKLEMSFASANDLVEMQDNLEKSVRLFNFCNLLPSSGCAHNNFNFSLSEAHSTIDFIFINSSSLFLIILISKDISLSGTHEECSYTLPKISMILSLLIFLDNSVKVLLDIMKPNINIKNNI